MVKIVVTHHVSIPVTLAFPHLCPVIANILCEMPYHPPSTEFNYRDQKCGQKNIKRSKLKEFF